VDYREEDFVDAVRGHTRGRGADVVLDVVGGDYVDRNLDALVVGGRIVQVGVMGGGVASVNVGKLLPKRAAIIGTVLRARPLEEKIAVTQRFGAELLPLFDHGRLRPVIDSRFPLGAVAEAHERMEANANVGKIVLDVA
jgi:NADPH2:quinone reductase